MYYEIILDCSFLIKEYLYSLLVLAPPPRYWNQRGVRQYTAESVNTLDVSWFTTELFNTPRNQSIHCGIRQYTVKSVDTPRSYIGNAVHCGVSLTVESQLIHRGVRQYPVESVYTLECQLIHRGVRQYTAKSVESLYMHWKVSWYTAEL